LIWGIADLSIARSGVEATPQLGSATSVVNEENIELPDILTELQDRTQLTRRSLFRILSQSGRLDDFKRNPQMFIEIASDTINLCKQMVLIDGIKYQKLGEQNYYAQELFEEKELTGYSKNLLRDVKHSLYEHIVCDSDVEYNFGNALENHESLDDEAAVKLFIKLPGWFKVPTPLGTYNPDWAVLLEKDGEQALYFVVETKGTMKEKYLRDTENAKIECGKRHFKAIASSDNPAKFIKAVTIKDLFNQI
jgi:type III restriction enzyme